MPLCIQTGNLTKVYGSKVAVGGLSVEVREGEVFGLLGPNGAGKTTTLYMLSGLLRPTSGSIRLFNKDLSRHFIEVIGRVGVLVERPAFYNHLTARRNLQILARLSQKEVTIDRALDRMGLLPVAGEHVAALSHGMRQRLGVAQALLTEPDLLLLDEPTAGLDVESTVEVLKLLRFLAEEAKVTIVFSSHMLHEVEGLCDRVAILNKGHLLACEETNALLAYDMNEVEVLVDAAEAARRRLAEQDWVESVEFAGGRLIVKLAGGTVHQLTAFLLSSGYKISGIVPRRRTLQDYFMKVLNA
jgi:ABC-2 type transport system ATP-binding protein